MSEYFIVLCDQQQTTLIQWREFLRALPPLLRQAAPDGPVSERLGRLADDAERLLRAEYDARR